MIGKSVFGTNASLQHTCEGSFYTAIQQQVGPSDCGLFTIASSCAIYHGLHPYSLNYDQSLMKSHLIQSLEMKKTKALPFPSTKKTWGMSFHTERIQVYGICRMPDDGTKKIACEMCDGHIKCVEFLL